MPDDKSAATPMPEAPKTDDKSAATPMPEAPSKDKSALKISWGRITDKFEAEAALQGCYVLRTDRDDLNCFELWKLYMTLSKAEDGFEFS